MKEQVDYYFNEEGLMVFTAEYHLKRGYCCKNECKHCPWNYGKRKSESPKDGEPESQKNQPTKKPTNQ